MALEVLRHHRLLELYLAETLDVPWDRVHDEAEVLEHHISEELEEAIAAKLGNPTRDPHGDPIPTRELVLEERRAARWPRSSPASAAASCASPTRDPEMLRYLAERGIRPGDPSRSSSASPSAGPLFVRFGDDVHALGGAWPGHAGGRRA